MRTADNTCFVVLILATDNGEEIFHTPFGYRGDANRVFKILDNLKRGLAIEHKDKFNIHLWGSFELDMLMVGGSFSSLIVNESQFIQNAEKWAIKWQGESYYNVPELQVEISSVDEVVAESVNKTHKTQAKESPPKAKPIIKPNAVGAKKPATKKV